MYQSHPSTVLSELFARKPYQGVSPEEATFLFVGLDANYSSDIEQSTVFPALRAYHEDGPAVWRRYGVHHPFLLPDYKGDGRRYHKTFAKIGFTPDHADMVSFAELLHLPYFPSSATPFQQVLLCGFFIAIQDVRCFNIFTSRTTVSSRRSSKQKRGRSLVSFRAIDHWRSVYERFNQRTEKII